ncbi:twitching motility protein PilT [Spirochaetia bacterium]|nr:twitching motility protein PilT [Spirochaetia bacterium]
MTDLINKYFIDSNIWIYSVDESEKTKKDAARKTLNHLNMDSTVVLSTQVVQEFYNGVIKKLKLDAIVAESLVYEMKKHEIVQVDFDLIIRGIDISINSKTAFWDGLIIAAAESAKCKAIVTEDLNDGQIICGMKIINPFN